MKIRKIISVGILLSLTGFLCADPTPTQVVKGVTIESCGIADIDVIRRTIVSAPTNATNVQSRRAALYRWWRLLWHQGFDMNRDGKMKVWERAISSQGSLSFQALDAAYAALEEIAAEGIIVPEVEFRQSGTVNTTKTNWPGYHGTNGSQTGYSPDSGPLKGKVAWRIPKGNFWYAKPVIEDGKIYAASPGSDVIAYCLEEKTGKVIWNGRQFGTQIYVTPGSIFTPVVSKEKVLVTTGWWQPAEHFVLNRKDGRTEAQTAAHQIDPQETEEFTVYKHNRWNAILADATTGKGLWTFYSGGNLSGDPVLRQDDIFTARQSGQVFKLGLKSNKPIWQRNLGVQLRGTPGIGREKIYLGDRRRTLHALSQEDGRTLWSFQVPESEFESRAYQFFSTALEVPASSSEKRSRVYVGTAGGFLYCLDGATGKQLWKHRLSDWIRSKPLVVKNTIFVATLDANLTAFEDTGEGANKLWQTTLGEHGFTADLVGNENGILASGMDLILYSVSPKSGALQWRHSLIDGAWIDGKRHQADVFGGQFQTSPTVVDETVYIGGPDGFLNAHDVETGKRLWRFEARGRISSTPCVADGKVFIGQNARYEEYYAIDQKTGEPIWTIDDLGWASVGSTAYCHGKLFVGTTSDFFHCIDSKTGRILWQHKSRIPGQGFHPPPATDDERVYTGSHDGRYYALNQSDGSVAWSLDTSQKPGVVSGGNPDSAGIVVWKNHLYVQKQGSRIVALECETGKESWEWKQPSNFLQNGTVAAHQNRIFGSVVRNVTSLPYLGRIYAFSDLENGGKEIWSYDLAGGGGGLTAPVITDEQLIFGSSAGVFMTSVDPETGELLWRCYVGGPMEEGVPALYGDKVFSHHRNGYFFAIE